MGGSKGAHLWATYLCFCLGLFLKQQKKSTNFSVILNNFDFFIWQKSYQVTILFYGERGGGGKKYKNCFRPIFLPFQAILNNFDFSKCQKKNDVTYLFFFIFFFFFFFGGGGGVGTPIVFTIYNLVRPIWKCKQNFRLLQYWESLNLDWYAIFVTQTDTHTDTLWMQE